MLPTKTIRDVALRCWWPTGKESRRGKPDEVYTGKTTRGLKENMVSATLPASFQIPSPNNMAPMHHIRVKMALFVGKLCCTLKLDGQFADIVYRINNIDRVPVLDSATRHLLEENNQLLSQVAENIETFKMVENMDLFLRTNNNIRTVLKRMNETPGIMGQMPPLPVPVNEGSLNSLQTDRMVGAYGVP